MSRLRKKQESKLQKAGSLLKKSLKPLIRIKISLLSALLLASLIVATPISFNKMFRSYVGTSVFIVKDINEERGSGSGFIVNFEGKKYFVTNNHVCEGLRIEDKIQVESDLLPGSKQNLKILTSSSEVDLCIAEAPTVGGGLYISTDLQNGDNVHVFGHPIGFPLHKTSGEIITYREILMPRINPPLIILELIQCFQISAPTSPGNSGSPVVDNLGRVVGILFAGNRVNSYTSLMIPSTSLVKLLESL